MKAGLYEMTEKVYRALPYLNYSRFKYAIDSAMEAHDRDTYPRNPPNKVNMGGAQHALTLTPLEFNEDYAIAPEGLSLATKAGKAWKAERSDKRIISAKDGKILHRVDAGIRRCDVARWHLENARLEVVAIWEQDGVMCKVKIDGLHYLPDALVHLELKGTGNPEPRGWIRREALKLWYPTQAAWVHNGVAQATKQATGVGDIITETLFLVHDDKTGECCPVPLPESHLVDGDAKWRRAFATWCEAEKAGNWAGRWDKSAPVISDWPKYDFEEDTDE